MVSLLVERKYSSYKTHNNVAFLTVYNLHLSWVERAIVVVTSNHDTNEASQEILCNSMGLKSSKSSVAVLLWCRTAWIGHRD